LVAIIGFIYSLLIPHTRRSGSTKKISWFFLFELGYTLKKAQKTPHLLSSILGSSYFLFIGGFTQLNIIPYAITSLGLSDIEGSLLFLVTAVGIGAGALMAGKISGKEVKLGLAPIGLIMIALFTLMLGLMQPSIPGVMAILFFLGLFGGFYVVPLDSYIQEASSTTERGENVAANNFLAFFGVLVASFFIYFFGKVLQIPPAAGFFVVGVITASMALILTATLFKPIKKLFLH
jgi:acyl-[acyl-carrier-protein]-phospholipid O-acyltransferase/long-chain-fatty-acid--[acyl-carrier-protein] ligase